MSGGLMLGISKGGALRLAAILAVVASAQACSPGSGDTTPKATVVGSFEPGAIIVAGCGERVAAWAIPPAATPRLAVYHQDPANRNLIVHDATLPGCMCNPRHLTLNDQWIVVAGEKWISTSPIVLAGFVQLAPAAGPYTAAQFVYPDGWSAVDRATAWGDRLVAVLGTTVRLYDIANLAAPSLLGEFSMSAPSTAIEAAGGGVFIFTANGYGFLDLAAGALTEKQATPFAGVERAVADGGKLRVGGASQYAGYYRVASFDPSAAPTLVIEADADRIADGGANLGGMTYDAALGEYILLGPSSPTLPGQGASEILRYSFDTHGVVTDRSATLAGPACVTASCNSDNAQPRTHANAGYVYAALVAGANNVPAYIIRLP